MKVLWEANDIRAGRRYSKDGLNEVWIIGYDPLRPQAYFSISLSDGLISNGKGSTRDELAADLTTNKYVPVELLGRS
jgi:hypothetical protein